MWYILRRYLGPQAEMDETFNGVHIAMIAMVGINPKGTQKAAVDAADLVNKGGYNGRYFVVHESELPLFGLTP